MRNKKRRSMRFMFVANTFALLLATSLLMAPIAFLFARHGFQQAGPGPFVPILLLLGISVLVGTALAGLVSRSILKPINKISEAAQQVARGDFSVRLQAPPMARELGDIFDNFNVMVEELSSIETLRTDFVVNVSHEFKTPLASIEGCATLLQDENATQEERREYTAIILDATRQLGTLTGNILKLSKLEAGSIPLERSAFRLDEQLRQAILLLERDWAAKSLEMDIELDEAVYMGNEEMLLQVWLNLVGNAVKFTGSGGRVRVGLCKTTDGLEVEIADNGPGMTREVQRHAFEKFYQANTARAEKGNGLGLALVQRIVEEHNGRVRLESAPGKGARFTVWLPILAL